MLKPDPSKPQSALCCAPNDTRGDQMTKVLADLGISEEVIEHDRDLAHDFRSASNSAKSASERRAEAAAALAQWRWEMCVCEFGPQYSLEQYAKSVTERGASVTTSTVHRHVASWQATLDRESSHGGMIYGGCSFGGEPHDQPEVVITPPTETQVADHTQARRVAEVGEIKAAAIEMVATHFGVAQQTVQKTHPYPALANEAVRRLRDQNDVESMTLDEIRQKLNNIALALHQEDKLRQRREGIVQRWMAANRAVESVPVAEVRRMMGSIERRMEAQGVTWEVAAADRRQWDQRRSEADRIANELARKARMAVLELVESSAKMKAAAIRLAKAMQAIAADEVPLAPEELAMVEEALADADGIVRQARAAISGNSDTDWDAELRRLTATKEGGS